MIALMLAAAVQFSPVQLQKALEDVDVDVRSSRVLTGAAPACNQLNAAILGAGKIRQILADRRLFVVSAELVDLNGGGRFYSLSSSEQMTLDAQATGLETSVRVLSARCRR